MDRGAIYATTGPDYTALAAQSARSLRAVCPDLLIDIFTDTPNASEDAFDRVQTLPDDFFRPKFAALRDSRFERTLYLDADTLVVADPTDAFDVLDRFDVAMAHDPYRNTEHATETWRAPLPAAFPQYNSGVIVTLRSDPTVAFWNHVVAILRADDFNRDQPMLRRLLFDSDLRIATLPEEYNLMGLRSLNVMSDHTTAPRILHSPRLHASFRKNKAPVASARDLLGPAGAAQLTRLIAADRTLGGTPRGVRPLFERGLLGFLHARTSLIRGRFFHR
ncbi:Nucleotide-diphospho-sugar transferase [Rhodobacteraceae bacterium THAF1]|uniref:putative nucleotide-diphospho-sugar transferase n=1 Tax=Palleronia sp. THAF1 TaxID=2587842 RepID=UPI000F3C58FD|nr:putative nucleotide-diphospho-sugar transferase [Palleronia sp. THAF1]QFU07849.1 Nucleotide-diphospho-sugar transferase [Palleronia sp. THAF1]VDC25683.1 Nucleotide-diphospho-sugar transferase [Rhodobacteraceae bacterium THAF1]